MVVDCECTRMSILSHQHAGPGAESIGVSCKKGQTSSPYLGQVFERGSLKLVDSKMSFRHSNASSVHGVIECGKEDIIQDYESNSEQT
jgi:hypothetical protein